MTSAESLARGLSALGIDLSAKTHQDLLGYARMLQKWNRVYNLTATRDEDRIVSHHLLDSLAVLPHLRGATLADIGSGGGLPGIPLALARPHWQVALVEASHKKASFLKQAVIELGMRNVNVYNVRVETWLPGILFDIVISRALSDLGEFACRSKHLLSPIGHLYAMKGVFPQEEIAQKHAGLMLEEVIPLAIPNTAAARHLVVLAPNGT